MTQGTQSQCYVTIMKGGRGREVLEGGNIYIIYIHTYG